MTEAEELEARLEELQEAVEEYDFLQMLLYLEAEGFIRFEGDTIYPKGREWHLPESIHPEPPGSGA